MLSWLRTLGLVSTLCLSSWSWAQQAQYLHLREEVKVYSEAHSSSELLGRFRSGSRLLMSTQDLRGWRKVAFMDRGKKRIGWIHYYALKDSFVSPLSSVEGKERVKQGKARYRNSKSFGLTLVPSYSQQDSRQIALSDNASVYNISELSGLSFSIGGFIDWPMGEKGLFRTYALYRNLDLEGSSKLNDIGGNGGSTDSVQIKQTFLGAGATYRRYIGSGSFWWGGGLEVGKNLSASVETGGSVSSVDEEDKPLFFFPHLATGWDSQNFGAFYLLPEIKLGPATSFEPTLYVLEAHFSLGYQW